MSNPPNYIPGIGRLSTDRYQFQNHLDGVNPAGFTDFRHSADQTDMNPPIYNNATTVQSTLAGIASFITGEGGLAQGFISLGDGYNCYANATQSIAYDPTVPSIDLLLNPVFAAITAYQNNFTPVPTSYDRIKDGGIIVLKAGTYIVKNTISVPPGITLMGEGYGTKIINATALNTSVRPPVVTGSGSPIFLIQTDPNRSETDAAISPDLFAFLRQTRICNLVICDNFVEPTQLGDTNYMLAQNTISTTPLIKQENGSNLLLDQVFLIGRTTSGTTSSALLLDTTFSAPNGTLLTIQNSTIDGFAVPLQWASTGDATNHINRDFLDISNCKIRAFGGFSPNAFILMNDNNANIIDNYFYGFSNTVITLVYINTHLSVAPNKQARSKIVVQGNNIEINRASNATNNSFNNLILNFGDPLANYCSAVVSNNNFQDVVDFSVNGVSAFQGNATGLMANEANIEAANISAEVNILTGAAINLLGTATINAASGTTSTFATGSILEVDGAFNLGTASTANINGLFTFGTASSVVWGNAANASLSQTVAALGNAGNNFSITAQAASSTNRSGGQLILNSGTSGTSITVPTATIIQGNSVNGALVVYQQQGTINTQRRISGVYQCACTTSTSGSVLFLTIPMPALSIAFVELNWTRRNNSGSISIEGNKAALVATCSSGNTVSTNTLTAVYTGSGFDSVSSIAVGTGTNALIFSAVSSGTAQDWQISIFVGLN